MSMGEYWDYEISCGDWLIWWRFFALKSPGKDTVRIA